MRLVGVVALAAIALQGCGGGVPSDPATDLRREANFVCSKFRSVVRDTSEGILTDAELRERLKEVDESSRGIATPEIRSAARAILSAITQDDREAFRVAITDMTEACKAAEG